MEEDYNWSLILKIAIPIALIEAYLFYTSLGNGWKWFSLFMGLLLAGSITYLKDKKKHNIFTAMGIIFFVALIVKFLKDLGLF